MASLGHIAVGAAASRIDRAAPLERPSLAAVVFWSALSFLPDADVIGFSLGVPYEAPWGHRGATHSFAFALAIGAAAGIVAWRLRRSAIRTAAMAAAVVASHSLLDILTDGGLGCALLWPFDDTRYFAPWRPIPVAPIGLAFFSPFGLTVAIWEAVIFAPLWWYAFRRRGVASTRAIAVRSAGVGLWIVMLWLLTSTDPFRERVLAAVLGDTTEYAPGFSEERFAGVAQDQTDVSVRERLGDPFREFMFFGGRGDVCAQVGLSGGIVERANPPDACVQRGVRAGLSRQVVIERVGQPESSCWAYSQSRNGGFFSARGVCFVNGRVDEVIRRWDRD